jgi:hypothetical protein
MQSDALKRKLNIYGKYWQCLGDNFGGTVGLYITDVTL